MKSPVMEQTRREGQQMLVLELLELCTGSEVTPALAATIRACLDEDRLTSWAGAAARASSLDSFRQAAGL